MEFDKYAALGTSFGSILTLTYGGNPVSAAVGAAISAIPAMIIAPVLDCVSKNVKGRTQNMEFNLSNSSKEQQYILGGALGATMSMPVCKRAMDSLEGIVGSDSGLYSAASLGSIGLVAASAIGGAYLSRKLFNCFSEERNKILKNIGLGAAIGSGASFVLYNLF